MMVSTARAVVCLSLCLCVCQVRGSHVPAKMNRTIQDLLQHYKIPLRDRYNGTPVFPMEPLAGRTETKRTFMSGVLETYEKLLGKMLEQLPTLTPPTAGAAVPEAGADDVRKDLMFILKRIRDLRSFHYQEQSKLLQRLNDLGNVKMDDLVIQSKALGELPRLYEEASSLPGLMQRRRRRQARKVKTHP